MNFSIESIMLESNYHLQNKVCTVKHYRKLFLRIFIMTFESMFYIMYLKLIKKTPNVILNHFLLRKPFIVSDVPQKSVSNVKKINL